VIIELVIGALLAAAAVVFVALPLLREEPMPPLETSSAEALAAEERDRALAELKELEFDHRTGKITDDDYRALVQPLRRRAASTLANGATLPRTTAKSPSQQHFSQSSAPSSRRDR
jgi:cytochrome c-type biogenesis protein CcmI